MSLRYDPAVAHNRSNIPVRNSWKQGIASAPRFHRQFDQSDSNGMLVAGTSPIAQRSKRAADSACRRENQQQINLRMINLQIVQSITSSAAERRRRGSLQQTDFTAPQVRVSEEDQAMMIREASAPGPGGCDAVGEETFLGIMDCSTWY